MEYRGYGRESRRDMVKYGEPIQSHLYATQVDVDFDM